MAHTGARGKSVERKNAQSGVFSYFATTTIAVRSTVSPNIYPACNSSIIVFGAASLAYVA